MDSKVETSTGVTSNDYATTKLSATIETSAQHTIMETRANTLEVSAKDAVKESVNNTKSTHNAETRARIASEDRALVEEKRKEQELRLKKLSESEGEPKDTKSFLSKLQRQTEACKCRTFRIAVFFGHWF